LQDPKFLAEIGKIATYNPSNSDIYTVPMAQFVATFERVAMPPEFKVFTTTTTTTTTARTCYRLKVLIFS